jgi:molybdopterin synthase catalytic subunit
VRFLTGKPLSLNPVVDEVSGPKRGAIVTFSGCVRESEKGKPISGIAYEAYPAMAEREMGRIAREAGKRWKVRVALRHRAGIVRAGEPSVVIACAGVHRREAFEACRFVIDALKSRVPVWKARFIGRRGRVGRRRRAGARPAGSEASPRSAGARRG